MILLIRTDSDNAELYLYDSDNKLDNYKWHAGKELSKQLLKKIENLLEKNGADYSKLSGIVVYKGPGSFTGLRIGITVANTLAYSLNIPIVGTSKNWIKNGLERLSQNKNEKSVQPEYGAEAHITKPRK